MILLIFGDRSAHHALIVAGFLVHEFRATSCYSLPERNINQILFIQMLQKYLKGR